MAKKTEKTNVHRLLDAAKVSYEELTYDCPGGIAVSGVDAAQKMGLDVSHVYKTLVTTGKSGNHYVFVIPVAEELNLKKAASCVSEKSIEMLKSKDLLGLTGYVHGGCSPIGMKKFFTTTFHESAESLDFIVFSAGKIGYQVKLCPKDLSALIPFTYNDIIN